MAVEYNLVLATCSQQGRSALDSKELNHGVIAGGISKINTADNYLSIVATDSMKAKGEMLLHLLKTRSSDGVGKFVPLAWNSRSLRITNPTGNIEMPSQFVATNDEVNAAKVERRSKLLDQFAEF